jgi:peptidoglycan-associated lipoprotein
MKKLWFTAFVMVLIALGCSKKTTLDDQLKTRPDTTATVVAPPAPPIEIKDDAAAMEREIENQAQLVLRPLYFEYNLYFLTDNARSSLSGIGDFMRKYPQVKLSIAGHCDERGSSEYNMALGQKRADEARQYLVSYGIASSKINTVSWGEEKPADLGHDEAAWSKNRRDEFEMVK